MGCLCKMGLFSSFNLFDGWLFFLSHSVKCIWCVSSSLFRYSSINCQNFQQVNLPESGILNNLPPAPSILFLFCFSPPHPTHTTPTPHLSDTCFIWNSSVCPHRSVPCSISQFPLYLPLFICSIFTISASFTFSLGYLKGPDASTCTDMLLTLL